MICKIFGHRFSMQSDALFCKRCGLNYPVMRFVKEPEVPGEVPKSKATLEIHDPMTKKEAELKDWKDNASESQLEAHGM